MPLADLCSTLRTSADGLTSLDATERLAVHGPNDPGTSELRSTLWEIVRAVANPLALILLVAAGVSVLLGEVKNALLLTAIVTLSAGLNLWQSFRSDHAVRKLQATIAPTATAMRDGVWIEVPRRAIVPGDVVRLTAGDLVPADLRLMSSHDLHVQQAALTGESLPAEKAATTTGALDAPGPESLDLLFLGSSVVSGTGIAVVLATGKRTAFGDIVTRLGSRPEETAFERGMRRFSELILRVVLFLVLFILVVSISLKRDPFESLLFAVALAVGLTPEFLPMIMTVTLARGAVRMAREKVIVKHLSAIQNLGSIDILCSDKTGTLTSGTMSLDASLDPAGLPSDRALFWARINSRLETGIRSPLDAAILARPFDHSDSSVKTDEIPFDFERRRLSVVVAREGGYVLITKGAPEGVVAACTTFEAGGEIRPLDEAARERCTRVYRAAGEQGFRVLAVAHRAVAQPAGFTSRDERDLTLAGFLTFADHLLEGVADTIAALRRDGVEVKILTGDNELVTRHICLQAGMACDRVMLGSEIDSMDEPALALAAERHGVFARLSPSQKHRIIRALRSHGHVVGFLGDGINDAASLHGADVGVSVAGAADVAREASDILLLEHSISVLHTGIIAGREAFGNVLKYLLMGTSSNFGNMFSMAGAAMLLPFLPMLPAQILLNNFLYDLAQITIPTDNVDPSYTSRPQRWDVRLIRDFMLVIGPLSSLYDFLTFFVLLEVFRFGEEAFHTGWFVESLATQTLVLFIIRTAGRPWTNRPSAGLTITTLAVVAVAAALPFSPIAATLGFTPLPAPFFAFLGAVLATYLALVEVVKQRVLRRLLGRVPLAPGGGGALSRGAARS